MHPKHVNVSRSKKKTLSSNVSQSNNVFVKHDQKDFKEDSPDKMSSQNKNHIHRRNQSKCSFNKETSLYANGNIDYIIGVDEVGRGCLAGPVVACACYIPSEIFSQLTDVQDSKNLNEETRERIYSTLTNFPNFLFEIAEHSPDLIDKGDILDSTMDVMTTCVQNLSQRLSRMKTSYEILRCHVVIDGNRIPPKLLTLQILTCSNRKISLTAEAVIKGDSSILSVSAASIIAKVTRDRKLRQLALEYPQYAFERHKGYATADHIQAIQRWGILPIHRLTFKPICEFLLQNDTLWPKGRQRIVIDPAQRRELKKKKKVSTKPIKSFFSLSTKCKNCPSSPNPVNNSFL